MEKKSITDNFLGHLLRPRHSLSIRLLLVVILTSIAQADHGERPNILWLTSEDNSPFLGCYGDEIANSPNIDKLAAEGVVFDRAYSNAAVCAPARTTLILGMYPTSLGAEHMRSEAPIPSFAKFYPHYLKQAGYYCVNNSKTDYNLAEHTSDWDESSKNAHWKNRPDGKPFFAIFNDTTTHESRLHPKRHTIPLGADPDKVRVPAYLPDTPTTRNRIATYYNRIEEMDRHVGERLKELEEAGLSDNTIVFYFSDHGGVMPRSKRFLYDSGTRVPLVVRIPKRWARLSPFKAGTRTDETVGFIDFAPTLLSIAGAKIPTHMQGRAFMGSQRSQETEYAYLFRGRADERIDFKRGLANGRYRYIRNYLPHLATGQKLEYLWDNPATEEWHERFKAGETNQAQSAFFLPAPPEELFDTQADPDEVRNLAHDPSHREILLRLRKENQAHLLRTKDTGFIPEAMLIEWSRMSGQTPYDIARKTELYPLDKIIELADVLVTTPSTARTRIHDALRSANPVRQYWGLIHCLTLRDIENTLEDQVRDLAATSPAAAVRITAIEYLARIGKMDPRPSLIDVLSHNSNPIAQLQAINVLEAKEVRSRYPAAENALRKTLENWSLERKPDGSQWQNRYRSYPARIVNMMFE